MSPQDWAMPVSNLPPVLPAADPTRSSPVGRNKAEREHLARIEGYIEHITTLIEDPETRPGPVGHYRARRASFRWALARIAEAEEAERLASDSQVALESES